MKYIDFINITKGMNNKDRGELFAEMSEEAQTELMDDYYKGADPKEMLLQVRIIGAAEMIEDEQKKERRDEKKIANWTKLYDTLVLELEAMEWQIV